MSKFIGKLIKEHKEKYIIPFIKETKCGKKESRTDYLMRLKGFEPDEINQWNKRNKRR